MCSGLCFREWRAIYAQRRDCPPVTSFGGYQNSSQPGLKADLSLFTKSSLETKVLSTIGSPTDAASTWTVQETHLQSLAWKQGKRAQILVNSASPEFRCQNSTESTKSTLLPGPESTSRLLLV